jgi:hypothetical protein
MLYLADPVLPFGIVVDAITETRYCISIIGFYDGGQMFQKTSIFAPRSLSGNIKHKFTLNRRNR